jgi:ankyrin repeat protein
MYRSAPGVKMAFIGCVGHASDAQMILVEEAVKENSTTRLTSMLEEGTILAEDIDRKHLLHQAAWLGYTKILKVLLDNGALPDVPHRKNGCTPLHLAHFCQVEDTNSFRTVEMLVSAGASVNNSGSHKCGKFPLDHAIQHQRLDSVQVLINAGSMVTLQSILISIDVCNPQILELLLYSGGECGRLLDSVLFWGQSLHRVIYTPLKCPRESYKQMFRLLVQSNVCSPILHKSADSVPRRRASNQHLLVETELKTMAKDYTDVTAYLYTFLIRNGFYPTESIKNFMKSIADVVWVEDYLASPPSLRELSVRVMRSNVYLSGNILHGASKLDVPQRIKNLIIMYNPY